MTKTLAEYAAEERQGMIGMWVDCEDIYAPCVLADIDGRDAVLLAEDFNGRPVLDPYDIRYVIPRFDLPRAWESDGTPPLRATVTEYITVEVERAEE